MKVLKFGGTSVQDTESIKKLIKIVLDQLADDKPIIVVTSAMGGITNQLMAAAEKAENGDDCTAFIKEIEDRHLKVIHELIPARFQNPVIMKIKLFLNELEELLQGISAIKELSPRTVDRILSYGELCSTSLVAGVLSQQVSQTVFIDARDIFLTDDDYNKAKVLLDETTQNIETLFNRTKADLYCVTGFIGATSDRRTTTLGRGGSDYTAAILGAVLDVDEIQIWTDVDGFMTADPRMVKKAFSLKEISYTEAKELSYFGASVIYPPTMIPAFTKQIPIRIKNTFNPDFPGTVIHHKASKSNRLIRGISSINEVCLINVQGSGMMGNSGFSGRLFSVLARAGINIVLITQASSEHSITFAVSPHDRKKAEHVLNKEFEMEIQAHRLETPEVVENLAIVAIVGENMRHTRGISGELFYALGRNGININAMAQGSSEFNISVVISKNDLAKALNVIHEAFFLSSVRTLNVFYVGIGNIGKTLLEQLEANEEFLHRNNSLRIKMIGLTNSRKMLFKPEGFGLNDWESLFDENSEPADLKQFITKMKELNLPNSVLIDNSASEEVVSYYEGIFGANISIVTCNKIGNSGPYKQYESFRKAVKNHGVDFLYETNVGASLPIIKTLKDLLISGDRVLKIEAILSGTISYIFNNFKGDKHFYEIVKEAQDKGFTEPDPRDDLSGLDFMRKMLILARECGYPLEIEDIDIKGILPEACMQATDVPSFYRELEKADTHFEALKKSAEEKGEVLRFIGIMEDGKVNIKLQSVDDSHPFYSLTGSDNIIAFTTNRYTADGPLVVKGPGAGSAVTAAGVFADLVSVGAQ